jgi:hypothetical protein
VENFIFFRRRSACFDSASSETARLACARGSKSEIESSLRDAEEALGLLCDTARANYAVAGMCSRLAIAMGAYLCVAAASGMFWASFAGVYCAAAAWVWWRQRDRYSKVAASWRLWLPERFHAAHAAACLAVLAWEGGIGAPCAIVLGAMLAHCWIVERSRRGKPMALAWLLSENYKSSYVRATVARTICQEALEGRSREWACHEEAAELARYAGESNLHGAKAGFRL